MHMPTKKASAVRKQKQTNKMTEVDQFNTVFYFLDIAVIILPDPVEFQPLSTCSAAVAAGESDSAPVKSEETHLEVPLASVSSSPGTRLTSSRHSAGEATLRKPLSAQFSPPAWTRFKFWVQLSTPGCNICPFEHGCHTK